MNSMALSVYIFHGNYCFVEHWKMSEEDQIHKVHIILF